MNPYTITMWTYRSVAPEAGSRLLRRGIDGTVRGAILRAREVRTNGLDSPHKACLALVLRNCLSIEKEDSFRTVSKIMLWNEIREVHTL
jgi:hypothetical protein